MKITEINTTPLLIPYQKPFHWAQGVIDAAEVVLVEVKTDARVIGYGESIGSPSAVAIQALLQQAGSLCIGQDVFHYASLMRRVYQRLFAAHGTCSAPRFSAQVLAGLEMALWDAMGKAVARPVHELLGGPVRDRKSVV